MTMMRRLLILILVLLAHPLGADDYISYTPPASGGLTSPVAGDYVATGKWTFGTAADAASSLRLGETAGCSVFEGATANDFETTVCAADPTADATFNWPALAAGTYVPAILSATNAFTAVNTITTAAGVPLTVDNGAGANSIFIAKDNNVAVVTVADGGSTTFTQGVTVQGAINLSAVSDNALTFGTNDNSNGGMGENQTATPDINYITTGSTSETWQLVQNADRVFGWNAGPCGASACASPTWIVRSSDQDNTEYYATSVDTAGLAHMRSGKGLALEGSATKALADATATNFLDIAIVQTLGSNSAAGTLTYTVYCADATNFATQQGTVNFACINAGGTESCSFATVDQVTLGDGTASIGAPTFTENAGNATDSVDLELSVDCTGVTPSTLDMYWQIAMPVARTLTPQ